MTAISARQRTLPFGAISTAGVWAGALGLAGIGALLLSLTAATSADYNIHSAVSADNAAPAIQALARGDVSVALAHQPTMGMLSLLLRAPIAWLVGTLGGGQMLVYRLGVLVCIAPAALLAAWLIVRSHERGTLIGGLVGGGLLLVGAPVAATVGWGHPEEVLTATLVVGSLICAERERSLAAGVLAGAAIGTKAWAIIGLLPILCTLERHRFRALLGAVGVAAVLAGLPALLDAAAYARAGHALGSSHLATALSAWWPVADPSSAIPVGARLARALPFNLTKAGALAVALGAVVAIAVALIWRARRREGWLHARGRTIDAFALLCLLAVVRCIADPGPVEYYYTAALIPCAVWEVAVLRRLPIISLLFVLIIRLQFGPALQLGSAGESALTLSFGGAMIAYFGAYAFLVGRSPTAALNSTGGR